MLLSVIIVNYNVKYYLEQCLRSVLKAGEVQAVEVIVVDNNSSDGSRLYLEPLFPKVRFIWQTLNPGFAKACNLGLAHAKGDYILFLNPDTLVPEDCFLQLVDFFSTHPDAGAVGVHMVDGLGRFLKESKRGYPSTMASLFKLSGFTKIFPQSPVFAQYYLGHLGEATTNKVDVLSGAFMAMPVTIATALNGFDEAFFMYGEDIDLSYRITRSGLHNYYFPGISILHFKGESTSKQSLQYTRNFYMAMEIFVRKYYSKATALLYAACIRSIIAVKSLSKTLLPVTRKPYAPAIRLIVVGEEKDATESIALYQQITKAGLQAANIVWAKSWNPGLQKEAMQPGTDVLFCIGGFSMGTVIKMLPTINTTGAIYFHYAGSKSIVCSSASQGMRCKTKKPPVKEA